MLHALILVAATLAAPPAAPSAPTAPNVVAAPTFASASGVTVVPAVRDLGAVAANTAVEGTVWLVNTSRDAVTIDTARAGCGCTTMPFETITLAPGATHEVAYRIDAPKDAGATKAVTLSFNPSWGAALTSRVTFETVEHASGAPIATARPADVAVVPFVADLGVVAPDDVIDTEAWLINRGTTVATVSRLTAGCGCTDVIGFAPVTLEPGAAQRVRLRITPGTKTIGAKDVTLTAAIDDRAPVTSVLAMHVVPAPAESAALAQRQ